MRALPEILLSHIQEYPVPGAGVGVLHDDRTETAFTGVTSVDNPLAFDRRTVVQIGSVSKTYTVTAVLRLVTLGRIDLDRPVRTYVPELRLADERVAERVTVRHLLNHTAGWDGTMTSGSEDPDAPLEHFVGTTLPVLPQVGSLGRRPEYNNAALALAGRVVEKVTETPFEDAVRTLLLRPLGLTDTHFTTDDLMTQRFTVGHLSDDDGVHRVATPWRWPRAANPEGGIVSTLDDQLAWARFHLGDGRAPDDTRLLDGALVSALRSPSIELLGNPMGDAIGLGWFLRDIDGEPMMSHAGSTNGQFTALQLVPGRGFGVIACANAGPDGNALTRDLAAAVLAEYLDLRAAPARPRPHDPERDGAVAGTYRNNLASLEVEVTDDGDVRLTFVVGDEYAATLDSVPTFEPSALEFAADAPGEFTVCSGGFAGEPGAFTRAASGAVDEVSFGGRWYQRVEPVAVHR